MAAAGSENFARPLCSRCARAKFSLPAAAMAPEAERSRHRAAAATICASRRALPGPGQPSRARKARAWGSPVGPAGPALRRGRLGGLIDDDEPAAV
jgi:hypothetical protein